ncbi:hypothetical protein ACIQGO_15780 [Streptomyces shenzhenensis]|uniref:hypothetical protein n=1 Tax=Streptomyces shenzhenensis TaxID=943815 RepID=UPI003821ECE4
MSAIVQKRTIPAMGGLAAEALTYGYTPTRLPDTLQGLTGIVQNTDYLPAGEHTRTTLGVSSTADWTEINYAYEDGTQRLARQTVVSETHTGTQGFCVFAFELIQVELRHFSQGSVAGAGLEARRVRRLGGERSRLSFCTTDASTLTETGGRGPAQSRRVVRGPGR